MKKFLIALLLPSLAACAATQPAPLPRTAAATAEMVSVGIIAVNDFHGALSPPNAAVLAPDGKGGSIPVPSGGAAWLASAVDSIKAKHPFHAVVGAGDLTSASQLASSLFLDEPAVGVMNRIGLDFNAVGNHEFDRGVAELKRLQNGGCEKNTRLEPCRLERFGGADYRYLSASTFDAEGNTLFPATGLRTFGEGARKVTVGFIGLSLASVPELVVPSAVEGLTFADEAETINRAIPELRGQGADAIVVLIHQGGYTEPGDPGSCRDLTGPVAGIIDRLDPGVDVVVSGHTHWQYVCEYGEARPGVPILLTSAGVYGKLVTDITLEIDPEANRVVSRSAHNVIVQSPGYTSGRGDAPNTPLYPSFAPRADVAEYVARYEKAAESEIAKPVGKLSGPASKPADESSMGGPLGNLIADSQLAGSREAGAQIAFMNPFGIRAPIDPAPDGSVTFGQVYRTQPFNNELVTMTLTGAQLRAVLEEGLDDEGAIQALAPSDGLTYGFDLSRPSGERLVSLTFRGQPVDPEARYRVTVSNFLAEGGDGYPTFREGTDRTRGMIDNEAFQQWLAAVPVRQVPQEVRSVRISD